MLQDLTASQIDLWVMESNAFVKSTVAVHNLIPPLVTFLLNQSVRCKVVHCLVGFSEASLIFCLFLVKHWVLSSVQNCREQFIQRGQ